MAGQETKHDADPGDPTIGQKSSEGRQKEKKTRWRPRLDKLNAQVSLPGGLIVSGVGVIGLVVVVLAWMVFHQQPPQIEVPNLAGMPRATAEAQLRDGGLSLRAIYEEISDQPAGMVLRSDPAAGAKLDQGAGVNLVIAAARGAIPSPNDPIIIPAPAPNPAQAIPAPNNSPPAHDAPPPVQDNPPPVQDNPPPARDNPPPVRDNPPPARDNPPPARDNPPPVRDNPPPPRDPVLLGVGRVDHPDPDYHDCATGYRFNFSQQISMTEPGRITYRWLRSDQASAPVEYVDFSNPGTQIVTTWWQRSGQPGDELQGWQQIEILTPTPLTGQRINFSYTCPSISEEQDDYGQGG